jgi:Short C-terminal domain
LAYLVKAFLGLGLFFGGLILFNVTLQELLDIGTCASGNVPFEIRQGYECPEGTGTNALLLFVSIIGGLIGCAIFAFRGDPPWGERRRSIGMFGWGTLAWGIFFAGTGAALMLGGPYGEITDPNTGEVVGRPDSELGANITGITFLVMGVPALLIGLWSLVKGMGNRGEERSTSAGGTGGMTSGVMARMRAGLDQAQAAQGVGSKMKWGSASGAATAKAGGSGGDTIGKIERLQKLRESGAITKAEFDREKAKILAEQ